MAIINREGRFAANVTERTIQQKDGAETVMLNLRCQLNYEWSGETWIELDPPPIAYGGVCLIKKDGTINETGVQQLKTAVGWDGNWNTLEQGEWPDVQVSVKENVYEGKASYKVAWIDSRDSSPEGGGASKLDPEKIKAIAAKYGSQTRAICGVKKSAAPAPKGKPPGPKTEPAMAAGGGMPPTDADIPF